MDKLEIRVWVILFVMVLLSLFLIYNFINKPYIEGEACFDWKAPEGINCLAQKEIVGSENKMCLYDCKAVDDGVECENVTIPCYRWIDYRELKEVLR